MRTGDNMSSKILLFGRSDFPYSLTRKLQSGWPGTYKPVRE